MKNLNDQELLRAYAESRSEPAFSELVRRHLDFVHSTALRSVRDAHLAMDVSQAVFVALAQDAATLLECKVLPAWLYRTTRNLAANVVRSDVRRRAREQEALMMNEMFSGGPEATWKEVAPHLDDALKELTEEDRDVLFLRYFKNHDLRTVGQMLGISDDAAQKRAGRAVERLREFLAHRGLATGAGGLALVISANAVAAAPAGLAVSISAAAVGATGISAAAVLTTAAKTTAMTTLQKIIVTAAVAALAGAGVYEARQASQLRDQAQMLQQQQAPLTDEIQQLRAALAAATNRLSGLVAENSRVRGNSNDAEVLRLRGEVTRLRGEAELANDPTVQKALRWKANAEKMKLLFAEYPDQQVPEMKLLSDDYFFDLARDQDLESSNGVRKAFSEIRMRAKNTFAPELQDALRNYLATNSGILPSDVSSLKPYFKDPVDDAMLDQYTMIASGKASDGKWTFAISDKTRVDPDYDYKWQVGPNGYGPGQAGDLEVQINVLQPAIDSYVQAGGKLPPDSLDQLQPFITNAEQRAAYDKLKKSNLTFPRPK